MRRGNGYLWTGIILAAAMGLLILVGLFWTPYDPTAISVGPKFDPPSWRHLLGTDNFGRDILSRVMQGAGTTFAIGAATVAIGAVCGTAIGALTGYFGGIADDILMRLGDTLTAFPSTLLSKARQATPMALGLVFIPSFARVTRTAFAGLRDVNYVKSARLMGAGSGRILAVHILPNTLSVLLPAVTIGFNNAVLAEASMSFLGIGVTPPDASLGYMLSEAQSMMGAAPWYAVSTGLAIVVMVFSVGLIGEGLRRDGEED